MSPSNGQGIFLHENFLSVNAKDGEKCSPSTFLQVKEAQEKCSPSTIFHAESRHGIRYLIRRNPLMSLRFCVYKARKGSYSEVGGGGRVVVIGHVRERHQRRHAAIAHPFSSLLFVVNCYMFIQLNSRGKDKNSYT